MADRIPVRPLLIGDACRWPARLLYMLALVPLLAGVFVLAVDAAGPQRQTLRAVAGVVLVFAGLAESAAAWKIVGRRPTIPVRTGGIARTACPWLVGGCGFCYLLALLIGPRPGVAWLYLSLCGVWASALLTWLLIVNLRPPARRSARPGRRALTCCRVFNAAILLALVAELGLRLATPLTVATRDEPAKVPQSGRAAPHDGGISRSPRLTEAAAQHVAGVYRVAILGRTAALADPIRADDETTAPRPLAGVEYRSFDVSGSGGDDYTAALRQSVARYQPHLVVCVVSVAGDVGSTPTSPKLFDWRHWQLGRRLAGASAGYGARPTRTEPAPGRPSAADYLERNSRRLTICRTPMSPTMRQRWRETFDRIDALAEACRRQKLALGLVVLPGDFQVNSVMRATLMRRLGYVSQSIDVDLPQRRLAYYAQDRDLPLLDLLPHLDRVGAESFTYNDERLSPLGAAITGEALESWLARNYRDEIAGVAGTRELVASAAAEAALR